MSLSARPRVAQQGLTLIGLLSWAMLVGFFGYLAVRIAPTVTEFYTIQAVVDRLAASNAGTVTEIRKGYERQKEIDATISSVGPSDLDITKENDKIVIRFAYEKEISLAGNVYLLIKYSGRSK